MIVVQAFTLDQASRLTGISTAQLRNWDRTGFFSPSMASENRREAFSRIYTFNDLASLKVLNTLRNETKVSMQHLREVGRKLASMGEVSWAQIRLYVLNKKVVFHSPETDAKEEVVSGQAILDIPLEIVRVNLQKAIEQDRLRDPNTFGQISKTKHVASSQSVISGTRVPVRAIRAYLNAGFSIEEIIAEYPDLTESDVLAVSRSEDAA